MKPYLPLLALAVAASSVPGTAQVIEIDASGETRTYEGPTIFTATDAVALATAEMSTVSAVNHPRELIQQAARTHRLDAGLLEALAWQESRGRQHAVSYKGARGVMQLMPATAAELGVDPSNMADNIRGGAIYLRRQLDRFGSVPLALAAYNAGPTAVMRFRGIPPYRETRDYVAKIMARWRPSSAIAPSNQPIVSPLIEVSK